MEVCNNPLARQLDKRRSANKFFRCDQALNRTSSYSECAAVESQNVKREQ